MNVLTSVKKSSKAVTITPKTELGFLIQKLFNATCQAQSWS